MTTRLTEVIAAILLAGCGKPVPETPAHPSPEPKPVEPVVEVARPVLSVKKLTAKAKAPEVPLWEAARVGNIEAVRLHLAGGMDANAKDEGGWVPLHGASGSGQKEIVKLLLANMAKVNVTALSGKTALDYAVRVGHKETANLLRKHGGKTKKELEAADK